MIVLAKYEAERDRHIINSIDGETVRSVSFYGTSKKIPKSWNHRLDELGFRSAEQYVNIMTKRGFRRVERCNTVTV
jgi:hypothetical protein